MVRSRRPLRVQFAANMALQRTRALAFARVRSLPSFARRSPLNARPLAAAEEVAPRRLPRRPDIGQIHCYVNRLAGSPESNVLVLAGVSGHRGS
jgi:hypothetical protein